MFCKSRQYYYTELLSHTFDSLVLEYMVDKLCHGDTVNQYKVYCCGQLGKKEWIVTILSVYFRVERPLLKYTITVTR